jgi:hypothetical protein
MIRKKRIFQCSIFLLAALCVLVFSSPYSKPLAEGNTPVENVSSSYAERIALIDAGKPLIVRRVLLGVKLFKVLAKEGSRNIDPCVQFLASSGHTQQQRAIAIMSMHELNVHDYVIFLRKLLMLYNEKLVSREELDLAVVPGNDFSTVLMENFRLEEVQAVLKGIAAQPDILPATRLAIERILSGNALDDMRNFRRDCCTPRN